MSSSSDPASIRNMRSSLFFLLLASSLFAQTYSVQKSNSEESLRGLSAPSSQVIWASGAHGAYLRSIDGGNSWLVRQVPGAETLDFRDVEAFDADLAYLLSIGPGEQSRIYKTTDGGKSWGLQFTNKNPKGFFDCTAFWDRDHGIVIGDPVDGKFELITTEDGGKNWDAIPGPTALPGEGAFAASGTCVVVHGKTNVWFASGGAARVFHSANSGKTWEVFDTPIKHGNDSSGIFSIAFQDELHGVIAGGDYKQPAQNGENLAFTSDGGRTWKLAPISPQSYVSAISISKTPADHAFIAVGSAHAAFARGITDKSWEEVWDLNLNAVTFYAPNKAIAVGPKGLIVKFDLAK
ncbi:MAG TPA: hypothetical protein VMB18_11825 [Terriglobales bacterium]|nr:hypothetical protein [Terriglobales bacterium]